MATGRIGLPRQESNLQHRLVIIRNQLLHIARGNCEVLLRDYSVSSAQLDCVLGQAERAVIRLRTLTEAIRPRPTESVRKPDAPQTPGFVGKIEVNEFGWVHIELNSLLPNCKYKTPLWLQNTLTGLLDICISSFLMSKGYSTSRPLNYNNLTDIMALK